MRNRSSKSEFLALLLFLVLATLVLTNGFAQRLSAQTNGVDVYEHIEPIGVVLDEVLDRHVYEPDLDRMVEGAIAGMMASLDDHSSYIPPKALEQVREDTRGDFEGIGITIKLNDEGEVMVYSPVTDSPAFKAGILAFDVIVGIDGTSTKQLEKEGEDDPDFRLLDAVAKRIRGPRNTTVDLRIRRTNKDTGEDKFVEVTVKRAKVPLESIKEARLLGNGIGYIRVKDFKENTADDLRKHLLEFMEQGMTSLVLDLRWNPGGLLTASREVCELFLPKRSLVVYTRGREAASGGHGAEDMDLYTERAPVVPVDMPMVLITSDQTASSAEIVTGALQFYERAIVVGEKTYGKGSVQTVSNLPRPKGSALRLTTALYYTPADVTIDKQGILPDVLVEMDDEAEQALYMQMAESYENDPTMVHKQNHGSVTGNEFVTLPEELSDDEKALLVEVKRILGDDAEKEIEGYVKGLRERRRTKEDLPLQKAVEILNEDPVWENLVKKYHRDVHETQMAVETARRLEAEREQPETETAAAN